MPCRCASHDIGRRPGSPQGFGAHCIRHVLGFQFLTTNRPRASSYHLHSSFRDASFFVPPQRKKGEEIMNNLGRILTACVLALGLALSFTPVAFAQTVTATLTGNVSDQSGALVPNVKVLATHQGTKIQYSGESGASGIYTCLLYTSDAA